MRWKENERKKNEQRVNDCDQQHWSVWRSVAMNVLIAAHVASRLSSAGHIEKAVSQPVRCPVLAVHM